MVAKTVNLTNRDFSFKTQGQAQAHYNEVINELYKSKDTLSSGQNFIDLKEIYLSYCKYTDFKLLNSNIISFEGTTNPETYDTVCTKVIFGDETFEIFSINKAIKEIADYQIKYLS